MHNLEDKQQADIGFPLESIHSALYIRINGERMPVMGVSMPSSIRIVNSFGQGKCTFEWVTISGCSKLTYVENWETNHLDHSQNDFYEDISYKFTLEWVYVWCMYMSNYMHLQKLFGTFYCDLLLLKAPSYSIITPTKTGDWVYLCFQYYSLSWNLLSQVAQFFQLPTPPPIPNILRAFFPELRKVLRYTYF